jgi:AMP phosphorylase
MKAEKIKVEEFVEEFESKLFNLEAGKLIVIMHEDDAKQLGVMPLDRVEVFCPETEERTVCIIDLTTTMVEKGQVGLMLDVAKELKITDKCKPLYVKAIGIPESLYYIKKKLMNQSLDVDEIKTIVKDISRNRVSEIELSAFMTAVYIHGFNLSETVAMTKALIEDGSTIKIDKSPILDKHCIGGINGRTTMLVVPIVAAEGFFMPKTSSRSITSAAGTADCMEVLTKVNLSVEEIKQITEEVGGVVCWGGAVELAPADDKIIKIEHPLSIDPKGQIVASVMAKKGSVGAKFVVIDLPVGPDVKVKDRAVAKAMAEKFIAVGKELGMKVEAVITDGTEPVGRAFGPSLEAKYVMEVLEGKFFDNLAQKSCELAGVLFELAGRCEPGEGFKIAKETLKSGRALKKMQDIIKAQGGKVTSSEQVELSQMKTAITAQEDGEVSRVNVKKLSKVARSAGAPADKKAGVLLHVEEGDKVKEGDIIYEIFSENARKLEIAKNIALKDRAVEMERIILEKIT